LKTIP